MRELVYCLANGNSRFSDFRTKEKLNFNQPKCGLGTHISFASGIEDTDDVTVHRAHTRKVRKVFDNKLRAVPIYQVCVCVCSELITF